jgi:hypothetical protein
MGKVTYVCSPQVLVGGKPQWFLEMKQKRNEVMERHDRYIKKIGKRLQRLSTQLKNAVKEKEKVQREIDEKIDECWRERLAQKSSVSLHEQPLKRIQRKKLKN